MLYVIGKPFPSIIITVPMLFIGILNPLHPESLSLNPVGWVSVVGIKIYPYAVPVWNVTYVLVGLYVWINVNVVTSPLVIVVPLNLP